MNKERRLNTPFKRVSFLALIVGLVTLAGSLTVWTQQSRYNKIFFSKDHFEWLPVAAGFGGKVERLWSWDHSCVTPLAQAHLDKLKKELAEHRAKRPAEPPMDFSINIPTKELDRRLKLQEAYFKWSTRETSLKVDLDLAKERLSGFSYRGFRESEINQAMPFAFPSQSLSLFGAAPRKDTRTAEEKFRDNLYYKLGLSVFSASDRDGIFEKCVQETTVGYQLVRTTYHSNLDDWPDDHPIPFFLGALLGIAGFMGSFGYRVSSLAINGTAGRLLSWVRTGASSSTAPAPPPRPETPPGNAEEVSGKPDLAIAPEGDRVPREQSGVPRFLPHTLVIGGVIAAFGLGFLTNDPTLARFLGRAAASAVDPVNLVATAILGFAVRKHVTLVISLVAVGVGLAVVVSLLNASFGARLTAESVSAKIVAALTIGYLSNLMQVIFKKTV